MRKRLTVDPEHAVASLVARRQALHIRCITCSLERYLSPLEAIATYGGSLHIQEITGLLRGRYRAALHPTAAPQQPCDLLNV